MTGQTQRDPVRWVLLPTAVSTTEQGESMEAVPHRLRRRRDRLLPAPNAVHQRGEA